MNNLSRTTNERIRKNKTRKILTCARRVFCRKGFLDVTMQDIIDECDISRGGIYLYFASVDEIFQEVINQRNKKTFSIISKAIEEGRPFSEVLANYMDLQKKRLLNIKKSLFRAYCEYIFSKPKGAAFALRDAQLGHLRKSIMSIMMLGVSQGIIKDENIPQLADHFIVTIDGLGVLALGGALSEGIVDEQFLILSRMIENIKIAKGENI